MKENREKEKEIYFEYEIRPKTQPPAHYDKILSDIYQVIIANVITTEHSPSLLGELWNNIKDTVSNAWEDVKEFWKEKVYEPLKKWWDDKVWEPVKEVWSKIDDVWKKYIWEPLKEKVGDDFAYLLTAGLIATLGGSLIFGGEGLAFLGKIGGELTRAGSPEFGGLLSGLTSLFSGKVTEGLLNLIPLTLKNIQGIPKELKGIGSVLAIEALNGRLHREQLQKAAVETLSYTIAKNLPEELRNALLPLYKPEKLASLLGVEIKNSYLQGSDIVKNAIEGNTRLIADVWNFSFEQNRINYSAEEEKTRKALEAIFVEDEGKITYKELIRRKTTLTAYKDQTEYLMETQLPGILGKIKGAWEKVKDFFTDWGISVYETLQDLVIGQAPVYPDIAAENASRALGLAIGSGVLAHIISIGAELLHPIKEMGVSSLAAFFAEVGNFSGIVRATIGSIIYRGIQIPYSYKLNRDLRPIIPREDLLQTMAVKPDITEADFEIAMSYHGYNDAWINAIKRTMYREPRYFELSFMLEDATTDEAWLYKKARRAGYSPEDATVFVDSLIKKVIRQQRNQYLSALFKVYKEGYIPEEVFDQMLAVLELRPEAHALAKKAADIEFLYDYTTENIRMFREAYAADLITEEEFKTALVGLGLRDEKVNLIINAENIKKRKTITRKVRAEEEKFIRQLQRERMKFYTLLYRNGSITDDEFYYYLVLIGLQPDFAQVIVDTERTKKITLEKKKELRTRETEEKRIQDLYRKLYITQYREDYIDKETLISNLLAIGIEPEIARITADIEETKKYKPEPILEEARIKEQEAELKKLYKKLYITQYKKDLINENELYQRLLMLGIPDEEAKAIVALEYTRKYKPETV